MLTLDYRDARPIYGQIKDSLRRLIVAGALGPDEKLPSIRALAMDLSINPNTIRRAYTELEQEGFIYSVTGKGSFAAVMGGGDPQRRAELMEKLREIIAELRYLNVPDQEILALVQEGGAQ